MILHVACLPFPSPQGTQAAIDAMLRASAEEGQRAHLLTYAHGAGEAPRPYTLHRLPDFPKVRSLRSGPSLGKVALDLRCIATTRQLVSRLRPRAIVAHHIEAALACIAARVRPLYYVAHTSLSRELPEYFRGLPFEVPSFAGRAAEQWACAQVDGVGAVAPSLAAMLGDGARYLPIPWSTQGAAPSLAEARRALGLPVDAKVCLYAGNLDRYQGWEELLPALARLRRAEPAARLLIATESDPTPARAEASRAGVADALSVCGLSGERARVLAHAAADLAWVPRRSEGGLPVKMLDAMARGVPIVAVERAAAGLPIDSSCELVPNDDPDAMSRAAALLLQSRKRADALQRAGRAYLRAHHSPSAFALAMRVLLGEPSAARSHASAPNRAV